MLFFESKDLLRLCVAAALLAGLFIYLLLHRRLRRMKTELVARRAEAANLNARIEEMQRFAAEQAQNLTNAYAEREDLLADSRSLREKLRDCESARDGERSNRRDDAIRGY